MEQFIKDFRKQAMYAPRAVILTLILILAYLFISSNSKDEIKRKIRKVFKNIWLVLFLFSLAFILMITIFGRGLTNPLKNIWTDFGFVQNGTVNFENFENILLFVPYVFFFLQAHRLKNSWKRALIFSLSTACCIEILQLLFWAGSFQFSDILHNTEGGMIGCGLWYLVYFCKDKRPVRSAWRWLEKKIGQVKK